MKTLFKSNKYTAWYIKIIENASTQLRSKKDRYYEAHHIIPKSFGGSNQKTNLVLLTPREHFVCHLLLPKMMLDPVKVGKMVYAFYRMKHKHKNSRLFERFRVSYGALTTGENNPFHGRTHTPETKAKISRLGKYHSAESKIKMSQSKKGLQTGEKNPMFGKQHPPEWRAAHSAKMSGENHFNYGKPSFVKGRIWVNNSAVAKMVDPGELPSLLDQGWVKGRLPQ